MSESSSEGSFHRLSRSSSVCLVWPLIWVGGLVTTYDAGMAVPDWPGTYGYNLCSCIRYDTRGWPAHWDLFIEHGHRLAWPPLVGLRLDCDLCRRLPAKDPRRWVIDVPRGWRCWCAVIFQGVLGGMRVVHRRPHVGDDSRLLWPRPCLRTLRGHRSRNQPDVVAHTQH